MRRFAAGKSGYGLFERPNLAGIEAELNRQMDMVSGVSGDLVSMAERIEGRRPGAAAVPPSAGGARRRSGVSTPVPVTRGSGTGKTRKVKPAKGV